eukprot:SAG11_NODE_4661_length_1817_cov_1.245052_2_plen_50_part_01
MHDPGGLFVEAMGSYRRGSGKMLQYFDLVTPTLTYPACSNFWGYRCFDIT